MLASSAVSLGKGACLFLHTARQHQNIKDLVVGRCSPKSSLPAIVSSYRPINRSRTPAFRQVSARFSTSKNPPPECPFHDAAAAQADVSQPQQDLEQRQHQQNQQNQQEQQQQQQQQHQHQQSPGSTPPPNEEAPKAAGGASVTWLSLGFTIAAFGVVMAYYNYRAEKLTKERKVRSTGRAAIGGPFTLVDHNGLPRTDIDFRGKHTLIYFGFTYCPDICPTELRKMARVLDILEKRGISVEPLVISVDPWRDTVDRLRAYALDFHPQVLGLTGTPDQVQATARHFRVYSSKTGGEETTENATEQDYLIDHSIVMYLMDHTNQLSAYYGINKTAEEVARDIESHVRPTRPSFWTVMFG